VFRQDPDEKAIEAEAFAVVRDGDVWVVEVTEGPEPAQRIGHRDTKTRREIFSLCLCVSVADSLCLLQPSPRPLMRRPFGPSRLRREPRAEYTSMAIASGARMIEMNCEVER